MRISGSNCARLALALATGSATPAQGQAAPTDLVRFFLQAVAEEGVVGAGLYVVTKDGVVDSAFVGLADQASGRRPDGATLWHWASITKTLGAIAVMQWAERGRLGLDSSIVTYVPELERAHNPHGTMRDVTVRHLLSHASGFRSPTWPWGGGEAWHPFEPTEWAQVVAMLPYTRLDFAPGSRYQYSNPGYIFLGQAVARLAGEDWEVYLQKNVLAPLGMTRAYFDITPHHLLPQRANSYLVTDGVARPLGLDFDTGVTVSNGGLNASFTDMAKYLRFLLGATPGDANPLPRATLERMWVPQHAAKRGEVIGSRVGLGFFLEERHGVRLIGHTGSQAGFRSFFWIHPESGRGILVNLNTAPMREGPGSRPDIVRVFDGLIDRFVAQVQPL